MSFPFESITVVIFGFIHCHPNEHIISKKEIDNSIRFGFLIHPLEIYDDCCKYMAVITHPVHPFGISNKMKSTHIL